jgi:hypothetical protein
VCLRTYVPPGQRAHMPTCYGTRALQPGIGRPVRPDVRVRTVQDPARQHQKPRRNQRISEDGQPGKPSNGARADPQDSDHPLHAKPGSEPQQCSSLRVGSTRDGGGDHQQRRRRRSGVSSHRKLAASAPRTSSSSSSQLVGAMANNRPTPAAMAAPTMRPYRGFTQPVEPRQATMSIPYQGRDGIPPGGGTVPR